MTKHTLSNHAGLCDECHGFAETVVTTDSERLKIGRFAEIHGHIHTHYELRRLYMIKRGIWSSLASYLSNEVAES